MKLRFLIKFAAIFIIIGIAFYYFFTHFFAKTNKYLAKYHPEDRCTLENLVNNPEVSLGDIDVTNIKDLSFIFSPLSSGAIMQNFGFSNNKGHDCVLAIERHDYTGIEKWNTINVTNMDGMFYGNKEFNSYIQSWDVENVTSMAGMFCGAKAFNQPLNKWNVANVISMAGMFKDAVSFNQRLNKWKVDKVEDMRAMFFGARSFNQLIDAWHVGHETNITDIFGDSGLFRDPSWYPYDY